MSTFIPFVPLRRHSVCQRELGLNLRRVLVTAGVTVVLGMQGGAVLAADFPAEINLSDLDGANGFVINGINSFERGSGFSVSSAGDVNGDGVDDMLIGAPSALGGGGGGGRSAGKTYVVFGGSGVGSTGALELFNLDGTNGFEINPISSRNRLGWSVSSAGDVNGDGVDDLMVGAIFSFGVQGIRAGVSYVVFGSGALGGNGDLSLSNLDGANGFLIKGISEDDVSGISVSNAGDVNGDGAYDLLIGASGHDPDDKDGAGASYVVFGGSGVGGTGVLELFDLDGTNGFVINGSDPGDSLGDSVSNAGDVNGDGVDDLLIGASQRDSNGIDDAGASYVVFGRTGVGSSGVLEVSDLDGTNGFVINGIDPSGGFGSSVSGGGDVNGDGIADLLIGAPRAVFNDNDRPETYVVFGGNGVGSTGVLQVSDLDGTNGFVVNGIDRGDGLGNSVSIVGDMNGDAVDDLLIGAPFAAEGAGLSYLIFGGSQVGGSGALDLSELDAADGTVLKGINADDNSGRSVSSAGDVNGDGVVDLMIGAPDADQTPTPNRPNREDVGATYIVFGMAAGQQVLCNGLPVTVDLNRGETPSGRDDVILGTPAADTINAFGGNDTICGEGGDDIINAGRGNDWVKGGPGHDVIRGGSGDDVLRGEAGDDSIMGDSGNDRILGGAGVDDIEGGIGNDTIFTGPGATVGSGVAVKGNDGADIIYGGPDADDIRGNGGADRIVGKDGDDKINGGPDDDRISGGSGNDVLNGGMGNDLVQGGPGDDLVRGDVGDDLVRGGAGNDTLEGGSGDDFLVGGASSGDVCNGQAGADTAASSCESITGVP